MTTIASTRTDSSDGRDVPILRMRFRGPLRSLSPAEEGVLLGRAGASDDTEIRARTKAIIGRVREQGDRALVAMAREYDQVTLTELEVPRGALTAALEAIDPTTRAALRRAADNIASVHRAFRPQLSESSPEPGIVVGRRPDPLARVGVYAPGGRAVYPSSVLMGTIPARVAGVREIVLCSPPQADGRPATILLAAAALAGVDRVFAIGGAGAIAAMALGTETVPRVDRVVGPGNAYVAEAKLQLTSAVAIDAPAGPSELLVIADETSDPDVVARELLAQAEHDPLACVVALAVTERVAVEIERAVAHQLRDAPRREIIAQALAAQGAILSVGTIEEALEFGNRYAPEHLLLALPSTERCTMLLADVRNAGTVFLGEASSNAFGDYLTGANHVLPTGGLARSYSGLSTLDFVRWTTYQRIDVDAAGRLADDVATLATAEGLPGHATAARAWARSAEAPARTITPAVAALARSEMLELTTYSEAREDSDRDAPPNWADLSDNTNLWGTPPAVEKYLRGTASPVARYPSPYSAELKRALADYVSVDGAGIMTGCGSDDVLDSAMRAFGRPGECIAYSTPTFSMIPFFARLNGLTPIEIPLRDAVDGYDIRAEDLVESGAKIIYICAPNNPTATAVSRTALEYVVDNAPGLVIVDEAYAEFAGATHVDLTSRSDRLLVARTLSKAFGLAGLRIGYGVGAPRLIEFVERARGPYTVTALAEGAARVALTDNPAGLGWVREHAKLACESRDRFIRELRRLELDPLPSATNFVLVPHWDAVGIARQLRRGGVLVRVVQSLPQSLELFASSNGNAVRIGVGPWPVMQRTLDLLAGALS